MKRKRLEQTPMQMDDYTRANVINKNIKFSPTDMQKILKGYKAESMDDKWNIVCDDGWINFQRSWTTTVVYKAHLIQKTSKTVTIDCIIYKNDIDRPTDIDDVIYMIMDLLNTFVL